MHFLEFLFCLNTFFVGFTVKIIDDLSGLFLSANFDQPPLMTERDPRSEKFE